MDNKIKPEPNKIVSENDKKEVTIYCLKSLKVIHSKTKLKAKTVSDQQKEDAGKQFGNEK